MAISAELERPTKERKVFGRHRTIECPVDEVVRLSQVRDGQNSELNNLVESIQESDLINPIDVAIMTQAELEPYIAFVNRIWKTRISIEDFDQQKREDGTYVVVIAGHSRVEALLRIQENDPDYIVDVVAKVHNIKDPEDIIGVQLSENIHSQPAKERQAMAIVETFQYGFEKGLWSSQKEFLQKNEGKISGYRLRQALAFTKLPAEARDFVFSGQLSYNVGVELGKSGDTIMEYARHRLQMEEAPDKEEMQGKEEAPTTEGAAISITVRDDGISIIGLADLISPKETTGSEPDKKLAAAYRMEIGKLIAQITNRGLNGPAGRKYIEGQVGLMREQLEIAKNPSAQQALPLMLSIEDIRDKYLKDLAKEYAARLHEMNRLSVDVVEDVLDLHSRLMGIDNPELRMELEKRKRGLGDVVLSLAKLAA